jgi:hypothetical protein
MARRRQEPQSAIPRASSRAFEQFLARFGRVVNARCEAHFASRRNHSVNSRIFDETGGRSRAISRSTGPKAQRWLDASDSIQDQSATKINFILAC